MDELVALGTWDLCCHRAWCSFHTKAGAASVVELGLVWVRVERQWLLKEEIDWQCACLSGQESALCPSPSSTWNFLWEDGNMAFLPGYHFLVQFNGLRCVDSL